MLKALIAELVARDEATSGFVYGFTSFVEKLVCGAVIMSIQFILDKMDPVDMPPFYRSIVGYGIGGVTILTAIIASFQLCLSKWEKGELTCTTCK